MTAPRFPAPSSCFCLCPDGPRRWSDLLADVRRVRAGLAGFDAVCNLAGRRYDFAAVLLAAMAEGVTTVLPSSRAEHAIAAALDGHANPLIVESLAGLAGLIPAPEDKNSSCPGLTGASRKVTGDRPVEPGDDESGSGDRGLGESIGELAGEVHVFTSGSTGVPVRHTKGWRILAGGARLTALLIERAGLAAGRTLILGTTPHQHMYGLEATIFAALAHGYCVSDEVVFYPADLDAAVEHAASRGFPDVVLVTSPPHLRFLEERIRALPQIRCVISATAPLNRGMAAKLEEAGRALFEIYGCTEAGSLAWRRSASDELWAPLEGFRLDADADGWSASAPHLPGAVPLPDEIELERDGRFRLLGRRGDMVRIAGKRQSLGALNAALSTLACVRDAVMVRETDAGEDRLGVYVVPMPGGETDPEVLSRLVREHMRRHVDPVFIPRRVSVVGELPRGATGKLAAGDLAALARDAGAPPPGGA